jgi:hypothetical protein
MAVSLLFTKGEVQIACPAWIQTHPSRTHAEGVVGVATLHHVGLSTSRRHAHGKHGGR